MTTIKHPGAPAIPLEELQEMLSAQGMESTLDGDTLSVRHTLNTTRVQVRSAEGLKSENGPVRAIVRMTSELPEQMQELFTDKNGKHMEHTNRFAALGALTADKDGHYIGSRLTIYQHEDAWKALQLPLLCQMAAAGSEAILGGLRRVSCGEAVRGGSSVWSEYEFAMVGRYLSMVGPCSTHGRGLTAELPLPPGAAGDEDARSTALLRMSGEDPHPELGGGLLVTLYMPQQWEDAARLREVCRELNRLEMSDHDQPPHLGAWVEGMAAACPAYRSFLPNALHGVGGIAVNAAFWALGRAQRACTLMRRHGLQA